VCSQAGQCSHCSVQFGSSSTALVKASCKRNFSERSCFHFGPKSEVCYDFTFANHQQGAGRLKLARTEKQSSLSTCLGSPRLSGSQSVRFAGELHLRGFHVQQVCLTFPMLEQKSASIKGRP
jgi:hypothetical protein